MDRARSKEIMLRVLNEKLAILDVLRDATTYNSHDSPDLKEVEGKRVTRARLCDGRNSEH